MNKIRKTDSELWIVNGILHSPGFLHVVMMELSNLGLIKDIKIYNYINLLIRKIYM